MSIQLYNYMHQLYKHVNLCKSLQLARLLPNPSHLASLSVVWDFSILARTMTMRMTMVFFLLAMTVIIIIDDCCFKTGLRRVIITVAVMTMTMMMTMMMMMMMMMRRRRRRERMMAVVLAAAVVTMLRSFMTIGSTGRMTKTLALTPRVCLDQQGPFSLHKTGCVGAKLLPQKCWSFTCWPRMSMGQLAPQNLNALICFDMPWPLSIFSRISSEILVSPWRKYCSTLATSTIWKFYPSSFFAASPPQPIHPHLLPPCGRALLGQARE